MNAVWRWAIHHPRAVVLIAAVVTFAFAPGWVRLRLNTDGHALVPQYAAEVIRDRAVRATFGIEDPIVILVRTTDNRTIYQPPVLSFIRELTHACAEVPGVNPSAVTSLATEVGFERRPNSLQFKTLIETIPSTDGELTKLQEDVRRVGLYIGSVVSTDERASAIYVGTPDGCDRVAFYRSIRTIIDSLTRPGGVEVHIIGSPVAEALLGLHILEDLGVPAFLLGVTTFASDDLKEDAWRFPASFYELRRLVARGIGLLPVTILLMMLVFALCFKRWVAAVVPLLEVGGCIIFLFGLMGLCSIPIYLTIAVVPIILTAAGVCDEIHILSAFRRLALEKPELAASATGRLQLATLTMQEMGGPIVRTSLTTAVGFASFAWAPIEPVRMFGIVTTVGVIFCMLWSLTVMPAMFVLLPVNRIVAIPSRGSRTDAEDARESDRGLFQRWADFLVRRRGLVIPLFLLLIGAGSFGINRLRIQDSWIDGFDPQSEFREATTYFNDQFFGAHILQLCIDAGERIRETTVNGADIQERAFPLPIAWAARPDMLVGDLLALTRNANPGSPTTHPATMDRTWKSWIQSVRAEKQGLTAITPRHDGQPQFWLGPLGGDDFTLRIGDEPMTSPRVMRLCGELSDMIRAHTSLAVGGVLGAEDYVTTTDFMLRPDDPTARHLPVDPTEIRALWTRYGFVRGPARTSQILTKDYTRALTSIYLRGANFVDTAELMGDIREFETKSLRPEGVSITFAGDVAVSQSLIAAIVTTQMQSLVFSVLGILAVTMLMGRSILYGIYCALPCALSLPLVFAAMGWLKIPLGVATSMFAAMIIGAGVDFAIHVLDRFRAECANGNDVDSAIRLSLGRTGFPVSVNAVALAAGMLVLTLSQVPANARLGVLLAIGLVSCLLVSLVLLPAMLKWRPLK